MLWAAQQPRLEISIHHLSKVSANSTLWSAAPTWAIAALSALYDRGETGSGQSASISVHEAIASCLEHVFMFYWYADTLDRKEGKVLPRRGALHWSDAYDVMKTKKGSIMITPTPDFDNQLMWLIEEGVQEDLIDPKYLEPENLRLRVDRSMEILRKWALTKEAEPLFLKPKVDTLPMVGSYLWKN